MAKQESTFRKSKGSAGAEAAKPALQRTPVGFFTVTAGPDRGQAFSIYPGSITIGRTQECDVQINDEQISRTHLQLKVTNASIVLRDLDSTNGTFIGGKLIKKALLADGNEVSLGLTTLRLTMVDKHNPLSGLHNIPNHDLFLYRVDEEIDRAYRYQRNLTIVMLHISDQQTDMASITRKVLEKLRMMDLLATYGQRDLELLLPETSSEAARRFIHKLMKHLNIRHSLKVGLATYPNDGNSRDQLIERSRQPIWMELKGLSGKSGSSYGASSAQRSHPSFIQEKILLHSHKMRAVYKTVMQIAPTPISVVIQGETGTGKELVAQTIHQQSKFVDGPFMAINCGAFQEALLESELFGHEKGAFTGASTAKVGIIQACHGGSLFLDEISELPNSLQAKLLRVLQENVVRRVGAVEEIAVHIRVICATNKNLKQLVDKGLFREDLYFRLNGMLVEIPPLRERLNEISHFAEFFLDHYREAYQKPELKFAAAAKELLAQYSWPGNVRELQNCVERAVVITTGKTIFPENLHLPTAGSATPKPQPHLGGDATIMGEMKTLVQNFERQIILQALQKTGWNQTKAAQLLKVPRRTLVSKIKKFAIKEP